MARERWKKCRHCGRITDFDEKQCPLRCVDSNPESELQIVELDKEEIKKLWKEGRVWTKHVADIERRFSQ